jgi:hypothetical protein
MARHQYHFSDPLPAPVAMDPNFSPNPSHANVAGQQTTGRCPQLTPMFRVRDTAGLSGSAGLVGVRGTSLKSACTRASSPRSRSGRKNARPFGNLKPRQYPTVLLLLVVVLMPLRARGQSASAPAPQASASQSTAAAQSSAETQTSPPKVIAFAELQGSYTTLGLVGAVDIDAGYTFSDHIAADIGVPLIGSRSHFSPVLNHDYYWSGALGEPYIDIRYTRSIHHADLTSILTGALPVGNEDETFVTGRVGVDWFNHIQQKWGLMTPFINVEASNGQISRYVMPRPFEEALPYETLGFMSDYEAGAEFNLPSLLKKFSIGGSAYAMVPVGPQKVFSRLVLPYSALGDYSEGSINHHRFFDQTYETTGYPGACAECGPPSTRLDRDNGFSGWVNVPSFHVFALPFSLQLGYTHSEHYALDSYTVSLIFDGRQLVKKVTGY